MPITPLTRSSVRLSSTLFADTPEETAARGAALVDQGYTAVKFGWGPMGESAEVDLALVQQARAGVGPDVSLLVDAKKAFDLVDREFLQLGQQGYSERASGRCPSPRRPQQAERRGHM